MNSKALLVLSAVTITSNIGFRSVTSAFGNLHQFRELKISSVLGNANSSDFGSFSDNSEEAEPTWMTPAVTWNICTHYFDTDQTIIEVFDYTQYPRRPSFDSRVNTDYDESMILSDQSFDKTANNSLVCNENIVSSETTLSSNYVAPFNFKVSNPKVSPFNGTGVLIGTFDLNGDGLSDYISQGTAVLVGPTTLLTAGHVLYCDLSADGVDNPVFADEVYFFPGIDSSDELSYGVNFSAGAFSIQREYYESQDIDFDWGLVELRETPDSIYHRATMMGNWSEYDSPVYTFGYPSDKNGQMWCSKGSVQADKNDFVFDSNLNVTNGNSGGGVFVDRNNGTKLVGVVSHLFYTGVVFKNQHAGLVKINSLIYGFFRSFVASANWDADC